MNAQKMPAVRDTDEFLKCEPQLLATGPVRAIGKAIQSRNYRFVVSHVIDTSNIALQK